MLYVYQSNQLSDLAALFASVYQHTSPQSAWAATEIVVQSQGMRRYLNHYLAQEHGIAANLHFSLPASYIWQLTHQVLPQTPALNPFQSEVLRWRLLGLFHSPAFRQPQLCQTATALHSYLDSSTQAPYHLAGKLADMFDQYLIYRNDWINNWQENKSANLGEDEQWQAELWRWLNNESDLPHRAGLMQEFLSKLGSEHLPERIFVFGIATMAPVYLHALQVIAQYTDVHIFAVNPCAEYWGNVLSADMLLNSQETDLSVVGHPLLASLGKQGRDFFDALNDLGEVVYMPSVYAQCDEVADTLLHRLQNDIQCLQHPKQSEPPYRLQEYDNSIQIVAAHSCLRELQILKEQLIQDLAAHPHWQPQDIAVLTPHIGPYLPFIHAVFGQTQGDTPALPYNIADVKISLHEPLLQLFEKLLQLMQSRFDIETVLPLLDESALRARFDLNDSDAELIHRVWSEQGVRWGVDADMRHEYGGQGKHFTWQQARERTVLGWLLPENKYTALWQQQLPWFGDIGQTEILACAQQLIDCLIKHHSCWQKAATISEWIARTRQLLRDLADTDSLSGHAMQQLETSLAEWQAQAALAQFNLTIEPAIAIEHLQNYLSTTRQAEFLRGGITFCSMVPMRSLPFRCICLLGLNDGEFPRTTKSAAFDLIAQHPRRGDRARRNDDRYLFLESILSAREKLYLSYIGKDIRKNEELAPSALLYELTDVLAAMTGCNPLVFNQQHIIRHPLQPFSYRYFNGDLVSCRSDYATALNQNIDKPAPFYAKITEPEKQNQEVDIESFIRFWRNPVRHWLQQQLQWQAPYQETPVSAAEPFAIENSASIYTAYTRARRQHLDFAEVDAALAVSGLVPEGELGVIVSQVLRNQTLALDSSILFSPAVADIAFIFEHEQLQLSGNISRLHQCGQLIERNHTPTAPDNIELYLRHLLLCATESEGAQDTYELYPAKPRMLAAMSLIDAQAQLALWLEYYRLGQSRPLPFFPKTSLTTALKWYRNRQKKNRAPEYGAEERSTAFKVYADSHNGKPQADYPEVAQVFGRDEELPIDTPLFWQLIEELLLPMTAALETADKL
nr:exodeoxyribonuclease V subunit gamma [Snodgrassella alvi]